MKDLHSNIAVVAALAAVTLTADDAGDILDLQGFNAAEFAIQTGSVVGAGDFTATVQHSDTDTPADFEDVSADDLLGELPATLLADRTYSVGYSGSKRYLRINVVHNGGTSIDLAAILIKGHPEQAPTA